MKNIDYESTNTIKYKQFYEVIKQHKIFIAENELYNFFCENKLILDVYDDLFNYNDFFSFCNIYLKSHSILNKKVNDGQILAKKNINMNTIESIKKIIQNRLKTTKTTFQNFFKNLIKSEADFINLNDFKAFLSENLGLYDLLSNDQIEGIFIFFDIDRDGKLSYSDFISTISSGDLEEEKLKVFFNEYMLANKINLMTFFRKLDLDCDNFINLEEFKGFIHKSKPNEFVDKSIDEIFNKIDVHHKKKIDFHDLEVYLQEDEELNLEVVLYKLNKVFDDSKDSRISETLFSKIDIDHSGSITYAEFMGFLQKQGIQLENKEFQMLFKFFDKDSNGKIEKAEFNTQLKGLLSMFSHNNLKSFTGNDSFLRKSDNFEYVQPLLVKLLKNNKINKRDLYLSFATNDSNNDGLISFREFVDGFKKLKINFDITDMKFLFKYYDKICSSFIEYDRIYNDFMIIEEEDENDPNDIRDDSKIKHAEYIEQLLEEINNFIKSQNIDLNRLQRSLFSNQNSKKIQISYTEWEKIFHYLNIPFFSEEKKLNLFNFFDIKKSNYIEYDI